MKILKKRKGSGEENKVELFNYMKNCKDKNFQFIKIIVVKMSADEMCKFAWEFQSRFY